MQRLLSLQEPDESDAAFAPRPGIPPQALSNYKHLRHAMSARTAVRVHRGADVSLNWLLARPTVVAPLPPQP